MPATPPRATDHVLLSQSWHTGPPGVFLVVVPSGRTSTAPRLAALLSRTGCDAPDTSLKHKTRSRLLVGI